MVVYLELEDLPLFSIFGTQHQRSIEEFLFTRKTCWKSQKIISGVLAYWRLDLRLRSSACKLLSMLSILSFSEAWSSWCHMYLLLSVKKFWFLCHIFDFLLRYCWYSKICVNLLSDVCRNISKAQSDISWVSLNSEAWSSYHKYLFIIQAQQWWRDLKKKFLKISFKIW